jgi:hypothetical protein
MKTPKQWKKYFVIYVYNTGLVQIDTTYENTVETSQNI